MAAVKFWGEEEVVYIVNRGAVPVDLGQRWLLMDRGAHDEWLKGQNPPNDLDFSRILGPSCLLAPGGVLEVRNGPGVAVKARNTREGCGGPRVILNWFGYKVWDNDGDDVVLYVPDGRLWCRYSYPKPWKSYGP